MTKKTFALLLVFLLMLSLTACGDKGDPPKSGADLTAEKKGAAQEQKQQDSKDAKSYQIKFGKYYKQPTVDYNFKEVELLTECLNGINGDIRPGQEFSYSSSASADGWSMSLKMTGQLGETRYRDGKIPALAGRMEFFATHSNGKSSYKFAGPFVLPFATLRPLDPDHETLRIGYEDVLGERMAKITYYLGKELEKELNPPEAFWFTVKPNQTPK